ncbi:MULTISPECIES: DUF262 domain-containing protein [unclassified Lentimonas]|uniref:DUF262 domain-containing protein n=1 Tax=unclassified Lentimonas TaxID=2630993 RepID=UPI001322B7F0|nr:MULTISPECIES: DUF262 domain-containing protein [unclassified Lentimonas]CAA6677369.1 Unannotated [Lentimonas sp. CC4]CAA6686914.1 Unannotated [Lentimonas sp. CC6]CAA6690097.1 Unannotated [Lentimonas sp. CC19]CAA6690941.1 Unannotated [Lentimonas sp. CC10]CAA7070707.1 Unannotated [Lentimonas sp. CC11]
MENSTDTLEAQFTLKAFNIPQYQRAYSWEKEPHLEAFVSDLRQQAVARIKNPEKDYFLGTLLLHATKADRVDVVDGQQRLTTSVVFIAAALHAHKERSALSSGLVNPALLRRNFIFDDAVEVQKFQTIEEDNSFFRTKILRLSNSDVSEESPSSKRLKEAYDYFQSEITDAEWPSLVDALTRSKVMVYSVATAADATQIFELQNDRGKRLTNLEAIKSYLMHLVYLHAKNPDDNLKIIQTEFSKIYRTVEQLGQIGKAPAEDAILSYHCASYLNWGGDTWRRPKELIKHTIRDRPDGEDVTAWVLEFSENLRETFRVVQAVLDLRDQYPAFAELVLLDRMASFWPLVIKTYRKDSSPSKTDFQLCCRLMEVYAMRGYGLSNLRADAGLSQFYTHARDFEGTFSDLQNFLHSISYWYDIQNRFEGGLNRAGLYHSNRKDAQYLLWRYENHLRSQPGKATEHLGWRQYLYPRDTKSKLSLEHIAAQNNPVSETTVQWEEQDEEAKFSEVATHRLGNLVIDSISANSAKGKYDFTDKLVHLNKHSTFLSQGELEDYAETGDNEEPQWTLESVKQRQRDLVAYALKTWSPDTYYNPPVPALPEESIEEEDEQV